MAAEEHTIDLHQAQGDSTDEEKKTRRFGTRSFIAGLIWLGVWNLAALVAAIVTENDLWTNENAQLFGVLAYVLGCCIGAILILVGANERNNRPVRERQAAITRAQELQAATLARVAQDNADRFDTMMGHVGALPHRLAQLENDHADIKTSLDDFEKLLEDIRARLVRVENVVAPESTYVQGIEDGLRMGRGARDEQGEA